MSAKPFLLSALVKLAKIADEVDAYSRHYYECDYLKRPGCVPDEQVSIHLLGADTKFTVADVFQARDALRALESDCLQEWFAGDWKGDLKDISNFTESQSVTILHVFQEAAEYLRREEAIST